MTGVNQIVPFAVGAGSLVLDPSSYAALPSTQTGYQVGVADPATLNTTWRQSAFVASMIAQFIVDRAGVSVLDDGNVAALEASFIAALNELIPVPPTVFAAIAHSAPAGDTSGSASAIVAEMTPPITAYTNEHLYVVEAAHACAGATNANFNGLGNRAIVRNDYSPLKANDWLQFQMLVLADNGTSLNLVGLTNNQVEELIIADVPSIVAAAPSISPPRNIVSESVAGTYTFTVPAGVTWILVTVVGGGGGGAGGGGSSTWSAGGGGSGGTCIAWIAVTPGQVITYIVGPGGAGGAQGDGAVGANGSTSSFGPSMMATGGQGGTGGTATSAGGLPGVGSSGQINLAGSPGGDGNPLNAAVQGGGGGASSQGGGGRTSTITGTQANGLAPGSGGGGIWLSDPTAQTGGNGAAGLVSIQF